MRFSDHLAKAAALFAFFFAAVSPSWADRIPVRGGSTYGDNAGLAGCQAKIADFQNTGIADNCEGFAATTFTIGGNIYNGAFFVFLEPGGTNFGLLDIIQLGANSSLTLSLVNPALPTGLFMCGSFGVDSSVAQDSTPSDMTGLPCTSGSSSAFYFDPAQEVPDVQANFSATGVTFVNGTSSSIAIFTEDGNIQGATATPEPGSLVLVGIGALVVGGKLRRLTRR
jgi:PEP-CTERM motif